MSSVIFRSIICAFPRAPKTAPFGRRGIIRCPMGLKLSPAFRINRQRPDRSFWQLDQSHREFLRRNRVDPADIEPLDEEQIQTDIEKDLRDQIAHNIHKGVLKQTATGDVKYSWRGMIYLWCQFLVDLVRL